MMGVLPNQLVMLYTWLAPGPPSSSALQALNGCRLGMREPRVQFGQWSYSRRWRKCCQPTFDVIHLTGQKTSLSVGLTGVGWPVLVVGQVSCEARGAPATMLNCKHLVTSLQGRQVTLVDGVLALTVMAVQEGILTLHFWDGTRVRPILDASECEVWLPYRPYGGNKQY